jgi:D-amino-acid dehydrogenase
MQKNIVIIGGGVIGACCAWSLARRGHRVTVLDRESRGHEGCSFGNCGLVSPSHIVPLAAPGVVAMGLKWMLSPESPFYVKPRLDAELMRWGWKFFRSATREHVTRSAPVLASLCMASRELFETITAESRDGFGFEKRGLLMLCKTQHALDDEARVAERSRALGIPAEVLDAKQAAALDPGARMDVLGAVFFPKDCHLVPAKFIVAIRALAEKTGVEFSWQNEATGWRTESGRIVAVKTLRGEMRADEFVVCGGAWSPRVVRELGLSLPMQAGKGYNLTLPQPRVSPALPSICVERRVAVTPMDGTLRFGGTMEMAGLDESINAARLRGIVKSVPMYYPEFSADDFRDVKPWCGLRPCSHDGLPYVGKFSRFKNLAVATGHAMLGLTLGPVTGELVGGLLSGEKPSHDIAPLSPERA